ncbi:MAG: transporter [Rhodocyclaceae bacterium]|nr:transporter [Rhodocyclaceae bacterium]MBX3669186.1 transporter [Rhodocyclaceae bacterium]
MSCEVKKSFSYGKYLGQAALIGCAALAGTAQAQVQRGFIGAHEYALPDPAGMKPWNVFVEYSTFQSTKKMWNANGNKIDVGSTDVLVSLSKFVHFWEVAPGVGIAWELIVPKVSISDRMNPGGTHLSGIADPLTGPAWWIKPAPNWTLGMDMFFLQVPIGDDKLRGTRWNAVASVFWDGQFDKINWTGNIATEQKGTAEVKGAARPGDVYSFNNRFGYRASQMVEPYIGIDYHWTSARDGNPRAHEWAGALGVMFHMAPNWHIAVHYEGGIDGKNMGVSNNMNVRFAYVF